jgi:hypothetical protein
MVVIFIPLAIRKDGEYIARFTAYGINDEVIGTERAKPLKPWWPRPNFGVKLARPGFGPAAELPTSSPA